MFRWIVILLITAAAAYLLDREIFFYEGAHLGRRVQGWLYDRWAAKYDRDKQASQAQDSEVLARPLVNDLAGIDCPSVLDVATGTGRFPYALLSEPGFTGQITAIDISPGMLARAAAKLAPFGERVCFQNDNGLPLPYADASFDVVSCLEALEVMPEMRAPLVEFARVLKPGGILVTSRGTEASGRVEKVRSPERFTALLREAGFVDIEIQPWWKLFDRVRARKPF